MSKIFEFIRKLWLSKKCCSKNNTLPTNFWKFLWVWSKYLCSNMFVQKGGEGFLEGGWYWRAGRGVVPEICFAKNNFGFNIYLGPKEIFGSKCYVGKRGSVCWRVGGGGNKWKVLEVYLRQKILDEGVPFFQLFQRESSFKTNSARWVAWRSDLQIILAFLGT